MLPVALKSNPSSSAPDGVAVRIFASSRSRAKGVPIRSGTLEILAYDGALAEPREPTAKPAQVWSYPAASLPPLATASSLGTGYELALRGVAGRVEFSLPPTQGANNVVNTLRLREVRWKQFRGSDCYVAVTYDERGIYGHLGGKGYGGVVNGQFNLLLGPGSPWNGWLSGTRIELKPITDALAPEKLALTGPANFHLSASARGPQIEQVTGDFSATRGGALRIGKIDDLIKELPGDWSGVKRGLSRISLEALRDFAYDTAHGDFRFHGREGALRLDLRGPAGSRKFAFDFHDAPARRPGGRVAAQRP